VRASSAGWRRSPRHDASGTEGVDRRQKIRGQPGGRGQAGGQRAEGDTEKGARASRNRRGQGVEEIGDRRARRRVDTRKALQGRCFASEGRTERTLWSARWRRIGLEVMLGPAEPALGVWVCASGIEEESPQPSSLPRKRGDGVKRPAPGSPGDAQGCGFSPAGGYPKGSTAARLRGGPVSSCRKHWISSHRSNQRELHPPDETM
jgi:hypothetical protein